MICNNLPIYRNMKIIPNYSQMKTQPSQFEESFPRKTFDVLFAVIQIYFLNISRTQMGRNSFAALFFLQIAKVFGSLHFKD